MGKKLHLASQGRGTAVRSDAQSQSFLKALGCGTGSGEPQAPVETESYKEFTGLLSTLRKKKQAVSRLEDSLGTEKSQLASCENTQAVTSAQEKAKAAQDQARDQLDKLRDFLATHNKAFV